MLNWMGTQLNWDGGWGMIYCVQLNSFAINVKIRIVKKNVRKWEWQKEKDSSDQNQVSETISFSTSGMSSSANLSFRPLSSTKPNLWSSAVKCQATWTSFIFIPHLSYYYYYRMVKFFVLKIYFFTWYLNRQC